MFWVTKFITDNFKNEVVFTLPSYNLVFKVIRDKFGYPKTISRKEVIGKYKLVSKHDRAGRLIDTQEFLNLEFPIDRFSKEIKDDLLANASNSVRPEGNNLLLKHVYVERRVRPLNLYINEVSNEEAMFAIIDYGQAIKDLAQTNIFTGDLLLKNFGVTQHKRVIFYDYDEVSLVSNCNFRDIPESSDYADDMLAETWYFVAANDIFPEEFIRFLSMNEELKAAFINIKVKRPYATGKGINRILLTALTSMKNPYDVLYLPYERHLVIA